ncbi:Retrovirus-related Pol polyprotein from transposon RE1 [Bienertia sinuspersici]
MSSGNSNSTIEPTSPLYLHPSDGTNSIIVEKLTGTSNYRPWRWSFEIALASKRKLGFVTGGVKRDASDKVKQESWGTCNSMVISWILNSVSDDIKKSVMFMNDAAEIWQHLQTRFSVTNGARKYSVNKQIYESKQQGKSVSEYYTQMKALWVELETLNVTPAITTMTPEINAFIKALNEQKEELRLFQFLSGMDDDFSSQRSQILMMTKLPTVEEACNIIQQEETQREVFKQEKKDVEPMAMHIKKAELVCGNCGKTGHSIENCWACKACRKGGHTYDKCWTIVGYPPKNVKPQKDQRTKNKDRGKAGQRWNRGKQKIAATAQCEGVNQSPGITAEQLEQLLKMLPTPSKNGEEDSNDEMGVCYAEMMECNMAQTKAEDWIIDTGATHHMTGNLQFLSHVKPTSNDLKINLPNGGLSMVSHSGRAHLKNGMTLSNVMYVPSFRHNLLSAKKLAQESGCKLVFHSNYCIIQDENSSNVKGIGKADRGLYCLINEPVPTIVKDLKHALEATDSGKQRMCGAASTCVQVPKRVDKNQMRATTLWHLRLGHAPLNRIEKIQGLKGFDKAKGEECITCPEAKFTKLPFKVSKSRAAEPFQLLHIDMGAV